MTSRLYGMAARAAEYHQPARAAAAGRSGARLAAVEVAATLLSRRWKPAVLWLLASGCRRFTQLAERLPGISPKVLTHQLRELEREGLVTRHVAPHGRKRVDYVLTPLGDALRPLLEELERWGRLYQRVGERARAAGPAAAAGAFPPH